jgi:hypothetical protein
MKLCITRTKRHAQILVLKTNLGQMKILALNKK